MKLFSISKDGGPDSTVWGLFFVEIKSLFSVALLCFEDGSREAYHEHAFNCISWILKGALKEEYIEGKVVQHRCGFWPILTYRNTFHKVSSVGRTWVLTFRGPWSKTWREFLPSSGEYKTLTHGRKIHN